MFHGDSYDADKTQRWHFSNRCLSGKLVLAAADAYHWLAATWQACS